MFSSKLPPLTLYCVLSSLRELTPAWVASRASMFPPLASGMRRLLATSSLSVMPVCRCLPRTCAASSMMSSGRSVTLSVSFSTGRRRTRFRVRKPSWEKTSTTLSAEGTVME